jgi:hypothetical protein
MNEVEIVIAVNKKDVWFCRICVASIRYYYPNVIIHLLKDELNGRFSTKEIEQNWNVSLIEYPMKHFGWSGMKMHFYCDERFENRKFLVLDSDIVFIGKLLDEEFVQNFDDDVIVCEQAWADPETNWFSQTYFSYNVVKEFDATYIFNGYPFNCGQLFCKGNFLDKNSIAPYFDFKSYPPWRRLDIFPLVDQSVFNYLFPTLEKKDEMKMGRVSYMYWSEFTVTKTITLDSVKRGKEYPMLIHWAGALRIPLINKMTRGDILAFFEDFYYSKIPVSWIKVNGRKIKPFLIFHFKKIVYTPLKRLILKA